MAHLEYIPPVASMSGKCGEKSPIAFVHMRASGRNYITHRPGAGRMTTTSAMKHAANDFGRKSQIVCEILRDPAKKAEYEPGFREQSQFRSFRAYLWNNVELLKSKGYVKEHYIHGSH